MITQERWKHILGVARRAEAIALELCPNDNKFAEDMFLLGVLHDIGYEFEEKGHALVGGEILKRNGYCYWQSVSTHGNIENTEMTDEMFILNCADMTVGPNGQNMTFEERLEDIALRHGDNSRAYIESQTEIEILKKDERYKKIKLP